MHAGKVADVQTPNRADLVANTPDVTDGRGGNVNSWKLQPAGECTVSVP